MFEALPIFLRNKMHIWGKPDRYICLNTIMFLSPPLFSKYPSSGGTVKRRQFSLSRAEQTSGKENILDKGVLIFQPALQISLTQHLFRASFTGITASPDWFLSLYSPKCQSFRWNNLSNTQV